MFVNVEQAAVHCGPDKTYYPTSLLKRGESVDVYHQTDNGWAAIRPPQGSFDWLAAENAYLLPGGTLAEVVGKPMPSWIGSDMGTPKRYRWQLELQPSQQMRVLGETRQAIEDGKEKLWYKISPPPGEFRWVQAAILVEQPIAVDQSPEKKTAAGRIVSTSPNQSDNTDPSVQQAQYVQGEEEIVLGPREETIVGQGDEFIVDSDETLYSPDSYDEEFISDEGSISEPSIDKPMVFETDSCHGCFLSRFGCGCSCRPNPNEGMFVHKLNGVLGLVGFGVAKLPMAPDTVRLGESHPAPNDVPSRLQHLPRPIRRGRISTLGPASLEGFRSILRNQSSLDGTPMVREPDYDKSLLASTINTVNDFGQNSAGTGLDIIAPGSMPIGTGLAASPTKSIQRTEPIATDTNWHAIRPSNPAGLRSDVQLATATSSVLANQGINAGIISTSNTASMRNPTSRSPSTDSDQTLEFTTPQLQDALIELSQIVARPTERWDLASLRAQALRWVEEGESAIQRGEARLLLERIDRFDSLRQRTDASNSGVIIAGSAGVNSFNQTASSTVPSDPASLKDAQQADASGWLTQVHTSQPGQPEFALTDLAGNVIAYVNPAPGVNLRRYNREAVAIYGARGYLPELAAKQIYAERVVRLR